MVKNNGRVCSIGKLGTHVTQNISTYIILLYKTKSNTTCLVAGDSNIT